MVSTINPHSAGAAALGVDQRYARNGQAPTQQRQDSARQGDRVDLGDAAGWSAARESVRSGLAQVRQALAAGDDVKSTLTQMLKLSGSGEADAQSQFDTLLKALEDRINSAVSGGARLLGGENLAVSAEPGGAPVEVPGADFRVKQSPLASDAVQVRKGARVGDPLLGKSIQASLDGVQNALSKLQDASRALEAHQGFLGAAEGAGVSGVRNDLDADAARLLALQVRQGLESAGAHAIANFEPQAVLSLFRS